MAYIIKRKNREGKYYVYLVEGYRDKDKVRQRTLKSYGSYEQLEKDEPGAYERLRREAKAGLLSESVEKEVQISFDLQAPMQSQWKNFGWKILEAFYQELQIPNMLQPYTQNRKLEYDLSEALKLLVCQRILHPQSKYQTLLSQKELLGEFTLSQNQMDRCLDELHELSESIQHSLHKSIQKQIGRSPRLVFYDVTNYYCENEYNDADVFDESGKLLESGLRKRGASKEHRPKPIIQMGLFMDDQAIPIAYRLFPGNQTDPITYLPTVEQVKQQFGIARIVTVADKAMNSKNNILQTFQRGDGWLFSQKHRGKRGAPKEIQTFILEEEGWQYNAGCTFAKKSMLRQRKLSKDISVTEKVLVTWSQAYANREKVRRDGAIAYIQGLRQPEKYRMSCKKGGKKYLEQYLIDKETGERKLLHPFLDIDYEQVELDAQFDGIHVLVTSEIDMSDEEMMKNYAQLYQIEDCFRITKSELRTRPIYVRKKEHINAHFLTCFLALVLLRILQYKTNYTLSTHRIIEALQSALADPLGKGYCKVHANEDFIELLKQLKIPLPNGIEKIEKLKNYAKDWCTTK